MPSVLPLPQEQSEWLMGPEGSVGTGTVLDSHGEPPLLWGGGGHCTASGGIATGSLSHPRKEEENHGCSEAFPQHLLEHHGPSIPFHCVTLFPPRFVYCSFSAGMEAGV